MDFGIFKSYGVLNETGTSIHFWGFSDKMEIIRWVDDEELQKIKDSRDPFDTPACPYVKPQPENLGKLIWLSGTYDLVMWMLKALFRKAYIVHKILSKFLNQNSGILMILIHVGSKANCINLWISVV